MRQEEFLFLIEEIGVSLRLSQNAIALIIEYYQLLTNSESNRFKSEIVIGACIFLVSKTREENKKIRDIINMCFVVTRLYRHANQLKAAEKERLKQQALMQMQQNQGSDIDTMEDQQDSQQNETEYIKLNFLYEMERSSIEESFAPTFTLEIYSQIKNEILQCEQHLLRLINYNLLTKKMSFTEIVLNYLHIFQFEKNVSQYILNLSNDTQYVDLQSFSEIEMAKSCIYLALDLIKYQQIQDLHIEEKFYDFQWWKEFMLISKERLLEFSEIMLQYYNQINS
ncbi:hypothetical protein TTHERM_01099270 (macronuclear) [Tetrahymena thermophila SB210]|uniref:Amine-terminal domain cyclin n=1 Tax=Tetrahymena thermophila (strain SB210) TaxID=312017 RepID=Q22BI6_TETTS|nr:hypothetical protein TTHERM_01099270 [Tetrahymena thermophila SB210]EAR82680.2 hypothetical protein TTHERM_01099270 [Tetrahymena thermophila SB210]|eukprot:XP_001030343.2 hypothetical protein TTHERM_01099270 [Tetrahymena thermophila SB210]